ncbi:MAG: ABC transporter substrate-binding protein [Pseudomonadota bacterium]|nr:ABC transporter substrate-binding protein [Pseudomonadota bacterium]
MNRSPLLTRRLFTGSGVVVAAALALPSLRAQPQPETRKIVLSVDGKAAFGYLPLTIAEQLGYFRAEGLEVRISDFASAAAALAALKDGSAEVCSGTFEHTIHLQARHQKYQAFVLQGRAPQMVFGVSSRTMAHYKSVADLRGKKIGVSAPGSPSSLMASLVLLQGGVKAGEASFVAVGTSAGALAALRSGQIDAISNTDPLMTMLEQGSEVKIISDSRSLKGTAEVFGGPMPAACLYAPLGFIEKNPNTCQALANAIVHSLKWLQTAGPRDIINTVPESYLMGDRGLYLAAFNKVRESISLDGLFSDAGPPTALKALSRLDASIKAEQIHLPATYTNVFASRAKERFKA